MKIKIGTGAQPVRLAFHKGIFEKTAIPGDKNAKARYNCKFILPPDHPAVKQLEAAEEAVAKEKWGEKGTAILNSLRATHDKKLLRDGNTQTAAGFEGNLFVSAGGDARPTVVDRNGSPLTAADGKPYSGCYVIGHINVWAQDNSFGKRINAELTGVQFVKDGDSFGGGVGPARADEFDTLSAEEDGEADPFA